MKWKVTVCREVWGTIEVEASSGYDAEKKVEEGEYDSEFVQTKIGNEGIYKAVIIEG